MACCAVVVQHSVHHVEDLNRLASFLSLSAGAAEIGGGALVRKILIVSAIGLCNV
jgi:hypothetical protein